MPSKKSSQNHGGDKENRGSQRPSSPLFKEGCDPIDTVITMVEKRARNLSKRKDRLSALQKEHEGGKEFDKDQLHAMSKLPEVLVQIDFLHDMQKQFSDLNAEYQRHLKIKQKNEAKRKKEEEKEQRKSSLNYCFRTQLMLEQIDEATKEAFLTGADGAVQLTEGELKSVDDFYTLVNPQRAGNPSFEQDLVSAVHHMTLLQEESPNSVADTTYKALHKVFEKIDGCGFLDKEPPQPPAIEDSEEQEPTEEHGDDELPVNREETQNKEQDYTGLEEMPSNMFNGPPVSFHQQPIEERVRQATPTQMTLISPTFGESLSSEPRHHPPTQPQQQQPPPPQHVSAPSPDFVGLGSKMMPSSMDFQFMRGDPQPSLSTQTTSQPSFTTTFDNLEEVGQTENVSSKQNPPSTTSDGQYVPETGQQMNEKSDLVGSPVVGGGNDKMVNHSNGGSGSYKSQSNGGGRSFDNRRPQRPNNNNYRQRPYNRRDGGNYGGNGGNFGGSGNSGSYGNSGNYGNSYGNKGMSGGRPRGGGSGSGGRGRPNYPYNRPPQNRSNGSGRNGSSGSNNRSQQPSYASTAATVN